MDETWQRQQLDTLPGIIWSTNADLRIVTCWGTGLSAFGAGEAQLPGRHLADVFETNDPAFPALVAHRNALTGQTSPVSFTIEQRSFNGQVAPIIDTDCITGVTMMAMNDDLGESRCESIANTAVDLILCLDLDGIIQDVNRTSKHLSREQVLGRSVLEFVPNHDRPFLHRAIHKVIRTGEVNTLEVSFPREFDLETCHAIRIGPVRQRGIVTGIILVATDITEHKRNARRLEAEELLLRRLIDLQDRERRLVAYEIHDGFIQDVIGARMMLQGLQTRLSADSTESADPLECSLSLLNRAISEGRRLISELRPMIIDEMGIVQAIDYLASEEEAANGMEIAVESRIHTEKLLPLLQANLFRITREAVTNASRHGKARHVIIRLTQVGDHHVILEIKDDGIGFDADQVPEDRYGLAGIKERARLFGGGATIETGPNQGTLITVKLPLEVPLDAQRSNAPDWQWTI